jgi:hypothetical protein
VRTTGTELRRPDSRVFDFETDLDHVAEAYEAMDQRRAIKSLIRVAAA